MSDLLEVVSFADDLKNTTRSPNLQIHNNHKRILRSKENLFKPKCNKELKKKLRKYKLRRDGDEDQDVLDVSQILVNSLRIKSPNNSDKIYNKNNKVEEPKPNNYLFKMVRKRKTCTQKETNNVNILQNVDVSPICFDEESQTSKQMDAFKLLMDSRNKSIGSNSPGKEKITEENNALEIEDKKAMKAKRVLSLQKMAENKGVLKKKEIEEYRENCIKNKMLKRAELFKDMLTKNDKKEQSAQSNILDKSKKEPLKNVAITPNNKTLKLCDIFSDTNTIIDEGKPLETVSDEDNEFLKKLSPSIRKKENMLCYFKKVSKETELTSEKSEVNCSDENTQSIIKVKFTPKRKKKIKTSKSVNNDLCSITDSMSAQTEQLPIRDSNNLDNSELIENNKRRKRKRNKKNEVNTHIITENINNNDSRPKRNTKKPVKYTEDVHCFSSDEELHIFTPKKKRNSENCSKTKVIKYVQDIDTKIAKVELPSSDKEKKLTLKLSNKSKELSNHIKNPSNKVQSEVKRELKSTKNIHGSKNLRNVKVKNDKKTSKLAPIFVIKPQLSQAALEAKQRFLKSGVPEKLKKSTVQQINNTTFFEYFQSVSHIQQNDWHFNNFQGKDWFKLTSNNIEEINITHNYSFKSLITIDSDENPNVPILKHKPEKVLKYIKSAYPKFPVYRTYHKLRNKCKGDFKDFNYMDLDNSIEIIENCAEINNDNPDKLNWCDKYKPTSSKQIIGNFESVKELKRWLETWSEKLIKDKTNASDFSDMSDFYCSDIDSRDAMRSTNNILIVTGQTGSGKTSSIYAVASELAIKVIEVNASSKRNGKIMLQDLQEATQSHKVNRAKSGIENSQKLSQEVPTMLNIKKRGRPKRAIDTNAKKNSSTPTCETVTQIPSSQECVRTAMSLILIDDADIIFDQDDGFCSAISQLIQSSKRPVILVTSSPSCPHLQKFLHNGKIIHMRPLLPRMLGTWLDIMCLADVGKCFMGLGEKMLDYFKGDIRKTINCLQFYMNSFKNNNHVDEGTNSQIICNIDDESSSMSWADTESLESTPYNEFQSMCNIDKQSQLFAYSSPNVFDFWWNLTSHLSLIKNEDKMEVHSKNLEKRSDIHRVVDILDTLCTVDYIDSIRPDTRSNITSTPWHCNETASLLESEDFNGYNESICIGEEISNILMTRTISKAQKVFKTERSNNYQAPPTMSFYRERDRIVSRHITLSSYLNPSAILDRRATALDYWPSCRTICKLEKSKTDYNMKRNNRFCHYLKSLNILCKNDFFDNLADSLT
ncbi:ATPase family AAA domain-containing protein 5 [Vanessa atalanta]|uniref:ATPase family AAA domain-containing protein 5 n=1 Tax=Vanessa atalanta TaxID=42275 RepID=UPI001FCDDD39|nr:ATPase family AAA domain-containing protein 5 [Vanessa atalanta]XP_047534921.1 ATPase family AAA domain-containing protein 5 [Vanessa atalanta]